MTPRRLRDASMMVEARCARRAPGSRGRAAAGPCARPAPVRSPPAGPTALALLGLQARGGTRYARWRALRSNSRREHDGGSALRAPPAPLRCSPPRSRPCAEPSRHAPPPSVALDEPPTQPERSSPRRSSRSAHPAPPIRPGACSRVRWTADAQSRSAHPAPPIRPGARSRVRWTADAQSRSAHPAPPRTRAVAEPPQGGERSPSGGSSRGRPRLLRGPTLTPPARDASPCPAGA